MNKKQMNSKKESKKLLKKVVPFVMSTSMMAATFLAAGAPISAAELDKKGVNPETLEQVQNHGQKVSELATSLPGSPEKGKMISELAKNKTPKTDDVETGDDDTDEPAPEGGAGDEEAAETTDEVEAEEGTENVESEENTDEEVEDGAVDEEAAEGTENVESEENTDEEVEDGAVDEEAAEATDEVEAAEGTENVESEENTDEEVEDGAVDEEAAEATDEVEAEEGTENEESKENTGDVVVEEGTENEESEENTDNVIEEAVDEEAAENGLEGAEETTDEVETENPVTDENVSNEDDGFLDQWVVGTYQSIGDNYQSLIGYYQTLIDKHFDQTDSEGIDEEESEESVADALSEVPVDTGIESTTEAEVPVVTDSALETTEASTATDVTMPSEVNATGSQGNLGIGDTSDNQDLVENTEEDRVDSVQVLDEETVSDLENDEVIQDEQKNDQKEAIETDSSNQFSIMDKFVGYYKELVTAYSNFMKFLN